MSNEQLILTLMNILIYLFYRLTFNYYHLPLTKSNEISSLLMPLYKVEVHIYRGYYF